MALGRFLAFLGGRLVFQVWYCQAKNQPEAERAKGQIPEKSMLAEWMEPKQKYVGEQCKENYRNSEECGFLAHLRIFARSRIWIGVVHV